MRGASEVSLFRKPTWNSKVFLAMRRLQGKHYKGHGGDNSREVAGCISVMVQAKFSSSKVIYPNQYAKLSMMYLHLKQQMSLNRYLMSISILEILLYLSFSMKLY